MKRAIVAIAAVVFVWAGCAGIAVGKVVYVDGGAGGAGGADNGTSWADAYVFLQDGLADANDSEEPVEIRVAQGVYRPDRSAALSRMGPVISMCPSDSETALQSRAVTPGLASRTRMPETSSYTRRF